MGFSMEHGAETRNYSVVMVVSFGNPISKLNLIFDLPRIFGKTRPDRAPESMGRRESIAGLHDPGSGVTTEVRGGLRAPY
jgi:hypothetical protein